MIFLVILVALAIMPSQANAMKPLSMDTKALVKGNNRFAWKIYDQISNTVDDGNIFFSPLSISLALGMTYAGANGTTKEQMEDILEFKKTIASDGDLNAAFREFFDALYNPHQKYSLRNANRLFGHKGYGFLREYLNTVEEYFRAPLEELDFAGDPGGSRDYINKWVEQLTLQKIKDLISPGAIGPETSLVLVNAIYFRALWSSPFMASNTYKGNFCAIDGTTQEMEIMLNEGSKFRYAEVTELNSKVIELPYTDDKVCMYVLLPNDTETLISLEKSIKDEIIDLGTIEAKLKRQKVRLMLPKFKLTQGISLTSIYNQWF